jgi:hypothetical protein
MMFVDITFVVRCSKVNSSYLRRGVMNAAMARSSGMFVDLNDNPKQCSVFSSVECITPTGEL